MFCGVAESTLATLVDRHPAVHPGLLSGAEDLISQLLAVLPLLEGPQALGHAPS